MAASNAPKHDFAPSWLKIPNPNENTRPAGSRNSLPQDRSRQRHDDGYYSRYSGGDYPRPLNRQNSFDMYEGTRRYSPSHASKFRHHSMEDDYYMNYYNYAPYPLAYNEHYSMQFRSQPSLPRQDMKYPPASSRFGQTNGSYNGFGPFCDFFPPGEGFSSYGGGGHNTKRSHYARDGRTESKESRDSDRSQTDGDEKDKIFNDDFPSLNGTDEDADVKTSKSTSSGGVWDNPPRSKFEESSEVKISSSSGSGLYKVMPTKAVSVRKNSREGIRVNGTMREGSPLAAIKPRPSREGQRQSPTQPMEVLSTRLVRPKPVDKKSEFLKALRKEADNDTSLQNGIADHSHQESSSQGKEEEEEEAQVVMNGVDELQLDCDRNHSHNAISQILSSSEEEELLFMRSLGWDETEETEEITEDEKREFLKKSMLQQQQRNGRSRLLTKLSSPQHLTPTTPQPPAQDLNDTLSSSDTDSDEDV
ncbi:uncharacterized protein LOC143295437 [Babylonia areolata]|uniref:uncharacterized protein LOC143295437 n=1 Tax=Babylonia areolata TaxID=304850 RepID=UPI003FD5117F